MAALNIGKKFLTSKIIKSNLRWSCRLISTSEKKKEDSSTCPKPEAIYKPPIDFSKPLENKNWVTYGYSFDDKEYDRYFFHLVMSSVVSIAMCGTIFLIIFYPDKKLRDWCQREAFIKLYEREQLGLDAIDPFYYNPATIILPPDEELLEEDIII